MMKALGLVLTVVLLAGCGTTVPMEELERQAFLTGDWSAVEKRERMLERRKMRRGNLCPSGAIAVCESLAGTSRCSCVETDSLRAILAGR